MIPLISVLLLLGSTAGIELDCAIRNNSSYDELFLNFSELLSNDLICEFKGENHGNHSTNETRTNKTLAIIYTTTTIPILTKELYESFPNTTACVFYNLSSKGINPDWFNNSGNLKELSFYRSKIPILEEKKFTKLTKLSQLVLEENSLWKIDKNAFADLNNLRELYISENNLIYLGPNIFKGLDSLKVLFLYYNNIQRIDELALKGLAKLEELSFSYNKIRHLHPNLLKNLTSLREIFFYSNDLFNLDEKIFNGLKKLELLDLGYNSINRLHPKLFKNLTSLKTLTLSDNEIEKIDVETFQDLHKIEILQLDYNKLNQIQPNLFKNLTSLRKVYLSENNITSLDGKIFKNLKKLLFLDLTYSFIKRIDEQAFAGLNNMQTIDLKWNKISLIQRTLFQNLSTLIYLNLNYNVLKDLIGGIFSDQKNLRTLKIANNSIEHIDEKTFSGLKMLESLDLGSNKLETLHPNIFKDLTSLTSLYLIKNPIKSLSETVFSSLVSLEILFLQKTSIQTLPNEIFKNNKNIQRVNLNANISKVSNKIFSNLKKLVKINFEENSCTSVILYHHNLSTDFTEDMLLSCSCKLVKVENLDVNILKILIVLVALFSVILLTLYKNGEMKNDVNFYNTSSVYKFKHVVKKIVSEYIQKTTIHGFNYIANETSFFITRFFWMGVVMSSMIAFTYYSFNTYVRWKTKPVILGFDEQSTEIFEIPLPAVTICSNMKFPKDFFNLQKALEKYEIGAADRKSIEKLEVASMICGKKLKKKLNHTPLLHEFDMSKILKRSGSGVYMYAYYRSDSENHVPYSNILLEDGKCLTFNAINSKYIFRNKLIDPSFLKQYEIPGEFPTEPKFWSIEQGYEPNKVENYPLREFETGRNNGFDIIIMAGKETFSVDTTCLVNPMSIKIAIHHPAEIAPKNNFFLFPFNKSVTFFVKPKVTKTSDNLRSYDPATRQCYFNGERKLKFFEIYTKSNCELECLTNLTLKYCNCSAFFMPRVKGTKICTYDIHRPCLEFAQKSFSKFHQTKLVCDSSSIRSEIKCNCFPPCNEITYDADINQHEYHPDEIQRDLSKYLGKIFNTVIIYFKENQFMTIKRSELYGFIEFISNCGGLMGLFMGVSLLSIIEILHYLVYFIYQLITNFYCTQNRVYVVKN